MTVQSKDDLTLARFFTKENHMSEHDFVTEWQIVGGSNDDFRRTIFHETTDLDAANDAANCAAANGFEHQIWFKRQGVPIAGAAFLVALDELLLDAHGRREYLTTRLLTPKLPMPLVVISRDSLLDAPVVVHPYLMLAPQLDDNLFRALNNGHLSLPTNEVEERKVA